MDTGVDEKTLSVEDDIRPCKHMEGMVSSLADGSLAGPARWYTQFHAMHCRQCNAALKNLRVVIHKVSDLRDDGTDSERGLPEQRRADLDRELDKVDDSARGAG